MTKIINNRKFYYFFVIESREFVALKINCFMKSHVDQNIIDHKNVQEKQRKAEKIFQVNFMNKIIDKNFLREFSCKKNKRNLFWKIFMKNSIRKKNHTHFHYKKKIRLNF